MEIPVNTFNGDAIKEKVVEQILDALKTKDEVWLYRSDWKHGDVYNYYIPVAREFVAKGYYAKVNYFVEEWKGVQCVVISKKPLTPANARLVYSEML